MANIKLDTAQVSRRRFLGSAAGLTFAVSIAPQRRMAHFRRGSESDGIHDWRLGSNHARQSNHDHHAGG